MNKNLHIASNSMEYPNKFVPDYARFLSQYLNLSVNDFVFMGDDYNLGTGFNYETIKPSFFGMISLAMASRNCNKIIFHSIPSGYLLIFLLFSRLFLSSSKKFLVLWGGEIHFLVNNNLLQKMRNKLNILFMRQMDGFITYIEEDYEIALSLSGNYSASWVNISSVYPSNVVDLNLQPTRTNVFKILIGSSALKGNKHKEIIDLLVKQDLGDKVEFIIPLSYGSQDYAHSITSYARSKLKGKLTPLTEFMPIQEYREVLSSIHAAIFMHEGQQAMGNIRSLLAFGADVYLKRDSVSYRYFEGLGFEVFDSEDLSQVSRHRADQHNVSLAQRIFSIEMLINETNNFLS